MGLYAEPRMVTRLDQCFFYHTMELPGFGVVPGHWDLRENFDEYIGGIDLKGNKIVYFSPNFGGLTFGVSYQPQAYSRFAGGGLAYGTDVSAPVAGGGAK